MADKEIIERVREDLLSICRVYFPSEAVDKILSHPNIAMIDPDAELPMCFGDPIEFNKALRKAGWRKVVKGAD